MNFSTTTLSNGLTIIGEQRPTAVSVAMGFFVRTGARDESAEIAGVSHFLEHMMFKGTENRSALEISYELGAIGAQANAFTSEENTVYYMAVLPEYFSRGLDLLSDMMRSTLDQKEFDLEKKVILEEIALYQDRPSFMLFEAAMSEFFGSHPAGNSVLGTTQTIGDLTQEQMKAYFDARYVPGNMVLAVSGNFEWDHLVEQAEKLCGGWAAARAERDTVPHVAEQRNRVLRKEDLNRAHICLVAPGPSASEDERYPAGVLSCVLGDSSGSRAFWELVDKGLADSASIDSDDMDGTGMVYGYASCMPEKVDEVEAILTRIMSTAAEFEQPALDRAVTKLATRMVLQGESSMRRLMSIGLGWTYRRSYASLEEELSKLKQVNQEIIREMLGRYSFKPTCALRLLPAEQVSK